MVFAIAGFAILIIALTLAFSKNEKLQPSAQQVETYSAEKFATQYLTGLPGINGGQFVYLVREENRLLICERMLYSDNPPYLTVASIAYNAIISVDVEDQSGIEKKFSMGRFLVMGAYAFAWLKKQPKEKGFLIIRWAENGTEHQSIFQNEDKGSLHNLAIAQKAILHWTGQHKQGFS